MGDTFGGAEANLRKADFLAEVANRTLHDLVIRCTKSDEIRDYFSVSIIGYGASGGGVGSAFVGQLAGRGAAKIILRELKCQTMEKEAREERLHGAQNSLRNNS
jgi:hypothetical protein